MLEAINLKFDEAFNKHDATAVGALYIANAAQVTPVGTFSGREAIEGYATDLFQGAVEPKPLALDGQGPKITPRSR